MLGICFHHEEFDSDVSSGTIHAIDQWQQLIKAFNIKNVAVINLTTEKIPPMCGALECKVFSSMDDFLDQAQGLVVFANPKGDQHYKKVDYKMIDWLVIGESKNNRKTDTDIFIPTKDNRELYPREAASIILAEASWLMR